MNDQIYYNSEQLVNVIPSTAIKNDSNELTERSLDLSSDYSNSNVHIVNYLPVTLSLPNSDLLQQQQHQHQQHHHHGSSSSKQNDGNYMQSKEQTHLIHKGDIFSYEMPILTPLKYVEYGPSNGATDDQIIMTNDDVSDDVTDDVSDCLQDFKELPLKNVKRSLPHKKRIAKKLNSDQFSFLISSDDSNIRSTNPQFECTECGLTIFGQLSFYVHLKEHYEGQQSMMKQTKRKRTLDDAVEEELNHQHEEDLSMHQDVEEEDDPNSVPENLIIESLEDVSQDDIKTEEIEGDAFEFSEPEDMEDFRKEVEKVVETIADSECMPDASWNYQVSDDIEENHNGVGMIENFSDKLEPLPLCTEATTVTAEVDKDHSMLESFADKSHEIINNDNEYSNQIYNHEDNNDNDDDDEDDKPLEEVRVMLKKSKKYQKEKNQNDKEEIELNECLKRIHNFKCNECNKAFNSRTALGYHLKTHKSERRYVCDQCGKKFLTNGALKVHLRLHSDDRPYQCNECEKSFRQWGDLKYHETSIHSNKKDHICEFCAKAFARKYSLIIHRRIHTGERNYKCTECDKSFRASSYLLNHKRIHTGEKPYSCPCGKKFRVQGDLKRHMKIHDRVKGPKEKKKEVNPPSQANQDLITPENEKKEMPIDDMDFKVDDEMTTKNVMDLNIEVDNNQILKRGKKMQKRKIVK